LAIDCAAVTLAAMSDDKRDLAARLELALAAGREAGQMTLAHFRQSHLQVEWKLDSSPVTVADREAEQHLRARIAATFPSDGILGEEFGTIDGTSGYRWIVDPIDGTKSFVHGVPFYGTMVGVERAGRCVVGIVYLPGLDEMVYASVGGGTWSVVRGGKPERAQVSKCDKLSEGLFCTTTVQGFEKLGRKAAYEGLQRTAYLTRTWGDCYGYVLVATGRAEAMVDPIMNVWDAAAVQPIVEEAGGTFTDWEGNATIEGGEGVATNGLVLEQVLEHTRGCKSIFNR